MCAGRLLRSCPPLLCQHRFWNLLFVLVCGPVEPLECSRANAGEHKSSKASVLLLLLSQAFIIINLIATESGFLYLATIQVNWRRGGFPSFDLQRAVLGLSLVTTVVLLVLLRVRWRRWQSTPPSSKCPACGGIVAKNVGDLHVKAKCDWDFVVSCLYSNFSVHSNKYFTIFDSHVTTNFNTLSRITIQEFVAPAMTGNLRLLPRTHSKQCNSWFICMCSQLKYFLI